MLPVINIGPLAVPLPQMLLLLGFWVGMELTAKQARRYGANADDLYVLALAAALAGLVGARLAYAARAPGAFLENPISLVQPHPSMFDPAGGLIAALLAGLVYGWLKKLPAWPALDAMTTFFAVMAVTIGLANFASGDGFGAPTQAPWAIDLWGEMRHPTQVYETLAALAVATAVWPGGRISHMSERAPGGGLTSGMRFWAFVALSAGARLLLESFRGDSTLWLSLFRQAQVIAWCALALSLWQVGRRLNPGGRPQSALAPVGAAAASQASAPDKAGADVIAGEDNKSAQ